MRREIRVLLSNRRAKRETVPRIRGPVLRFRDHESKETIIKPLETERRGGRGTVDCFFSFAEAEDEQVTVFRRKFRDG